MRPAACDLLTIPTAVVIFDRAEDVVRMEARIKTLDTWCDAHSVRVVGQFAAAGIALAAEHPTALVNAVNLAHLMGAALLVSSVETISTQPAVVGALLRVLEPRMAWTPAGRIVINQFHEVAVIELPDSTDG